MRMFSSLIVDPESAVLGYPEETQIPMNADHRSICKFETPDDANYSLLGNALASTVKSLSARLSAEQQTEKRNKATDLREFLGAVDVPDEDFLAASEARM